MTAQLGAPAEAPTALRERTPRHPARRAAVVAAAVTTIDQDGPRVEVTHLVAKLGISGPALNHCFRGHRDLHRAIADHIARETVDSLLPTLHLSPATTPRQVIAAAVHAIVGWPGEHPNRYRFLRTQDGGTQLMRVQTILADKVTQLIQTALARLGADPTQAQADANGITGYLAATRRWQQLPQLATHAVRHLIEGTLRDSGLPLALDDPLPGA